MRRATKPERCPAGEPGLRHWKEGTARYVVSELRDAPSI